MEGSLGSVNSVSTRTRSTRALSTARSSPVGKVLSSSERVFQPVHFSTYWSLPCLGINSRGRRPCSCVSLESSVWVILQETLVDILWAHWPELGHMPTEKLISGERDMTGWDLIIFAPWSYGVTQRYCLNACVAPKFIILTPKGDGIRRWGLWELFRSCEWSHHEWD